MTWRWWPPASSTSPRRKPGPSPEEGGERAPSPYLIQRRDANGAVEGPSSADLLQEGQGEPRLPDDAAWFQAHAHKPVTVPATEGGGRWRVLVQPREDEPGGTVVVAASLDGIDNAIARLRLVDLVVSLAVLVALAGVGVAIVRASLRPLAEMEQTAEAIAAGDLTRRVPDRDPRTEVGRLAAALNSMLAQIEAAFRARAASEATARRSEERMRRFVADASHELRTPLTTSAASPSCTGSRAAAWSPASWTGCCAASRTRRPGWGCWWRTCCCWPAWTSSARWTGARSTCWRWPPRRSTTPAPSPPTGASSCSSPTGGGPLVVLGDEDRLRQVIANLMRNALTHTPAGSPIELRAGARRGDGSHAAIEVVDHGPGLTQEQAERVFERFYRADPARTRAHGGAGLGLSIVAALVAAHGGTVEVASVPGQGASFRVLLPLDCGTPAT